MRVSFSLRAVLVLLTAASIFAFRYGQRRDLQLARIAIEEKGGTVFFRWQEPCVTNQPVMIGGGCCSSQGSYTTNRCEPRTRESLGFSVAGFLLGYHDDVDIAAVSLPAAFVNEDTTAVLHRLHSLKIVVLCVDEVYYTFESRPDLPILSPEIRRKLLQKLEQDLARASAILESNFPDVKLFRRGVVPCAG